MDRKPKMKMYLPGHEKGYELSIEKSEREKEGWVLLVIQYGNSEELKLSTSVNAEDLANALKAFIPTTLTDK